MCVIIHTPANEQPISREVFDRASTSNPDGIGVAWVEGGTVRTTRRVRRFGRAYRQYRDLVLTGHEVLLHCRLGTSGPSDISMVHPFSVSKDNSAVMAHNGVILGMGNKSESDTAVLARALRDIPLQYWWRNNNTWPLLSEVMEGSKFAFLRSDGEVWIPQRDLGIVKDGSWFSNEGPLHDWRYKGNSKYGYKPEWTKFDEDMYDSYGSRFEGRKALPPARTRGTNYEESWSVDGAPLCINCISGFWKDAALIWSTNPRCILCHEPAGVDVVAPFAQ